LLTTFSSIVFSLEDEIFKPLPIGAASNARVEFYERFKCTADEHDQYFIKENAENLNTTLIVVNTLSESASLFWI
jgi:hypothetical protein